jgi:hypothetical protein
MVEFAARIHKRRIKLPFWVREFKENQLVDVTVEPKEEEEE